MQPIHGQRASSLSRRLPLASGPHQPTFGISHTPRFILGASICALVLTSILYLGISRDAELPHAGQAVQKRAGSKELASDLYGLGVRVGLYLQAAGMLFSVAAGKVGEVRSASASVMIALLACWTVLAGERAFSPIEAFLVLELFAISMIAAEMTLFFKSKKENFLGLVLFTISIFWWCILIFWFWAKLNTDLPDLGTTGEFWSLWHSNLHHRWLKGVSLAGTVVVLLVLLPLIFYAIYCFKSGEDSGSIFVFFPHEDDDEFLRLLQSKLGKRFIMGFVILVGLSSLAIAVASVEKTIRYNDLRPTVRLSAPGQLIPLATGIVVLVDGIWNVLRPAD